MTPKPTSPPYIDWNFIYLWGDEEPGDVPIRFITNLAEAKKFWVSAGYAELCAHRWKDHPILARRESTGSTVFVYSPGRRS